MTTHNCGPVTAVANEIWEHWDNPAQHKNTVTNNTPKRSDLQLITPETHLKTHHTLNHNDDHLILLNTPLEYDALVLSVTKQGGTARGSFVVCKVDRNVQLTKLWDVEFASGERNIDKVMTRRLEGMKDHLLSVYVVKGSASRVFSFELAFEFVTP